MRRPEGFDDDPQRSPRPPRQEPEQRRPDRAPRTAEPSPEPEREPTPDPEVATDAPTQEVAPAVVARGRGRRRSESHASRTDRLLREAELRQLRLDRAESRRTASVAKQADRARRRAERSEVRRFTAASRRRVRRGLVAVGALAVAFALLVGLVHSPLMAVSEIEVRGTQRVDATAIQAALSDHMGQPIATITDAGVRDDLQRFSGLESFVVDVVPPGTIVVRVVERQPVVVASVEEQDVMLDPAGVELGMPDGTALPRLEDVEVDSDAFMAVAASLVAMPDELRAQVASITASTTDDVSMTLETGQRVVWGSAQDSGQKAVVLAALVASADPATIVTFDVSAPDHPVVRP